MRGLIACSGVCRTWRDLARDPQLWNKIDLSTFTDRLFSHTHPPSNTNFFPISQDFFKSFKLAFCSSFLFVSLQYFPCLPHISLRLRGRGLEGQLHRHRAVIGHLSLRGCSSLSPDSLKIIGQPLPPSPLPPLYIQSLVTPVCHLLLQENATIFKI